MLPPVGGGGGTATTNEKLLLALLLPASFTCAEKENVPVCVVVPESTPVLARTKPCGNEPEATFH